MIEFRNRQRIKLVAVSLVLVAIIHHLAVEMDVDLPIVAALLGILPALLLEIRQTLQRPNLVVENTRIVKYPSYWFDIENGFQGEESNLVCFRAQVRNDGNKLLEECRIRIKSPITDAKYETRWARSDHPVSINLSPNEVQSIDLFWYDIKNKVVLSPALGEVTVAEQENNRDYPKRRIYSFPEDIRGLCAVAVGDNMAEKSLTFQFTQGLNGSIPRDSYEISEEWETASRVKEQSSKYAIIYEKDEKNDLYVPEDMDLSELQPSVHPIFAGKGGRSFQIYADEDYNIIRE